MAIVEELIAGLDSPEHRDAAVEGLIALGKLALSPIEQAVLDSNRSPTARQLCAELLGQFVPDGVDWLLKTLSTSRDEAGDYAAWGLRFNHAPGRTEKVLFDLASNTTTRVRLNAARALLFINVDLQGWDSVVLQLTRDPDERVRAAGMELLVELAEATALLERLSLDEVTSAVEFAAQDVSQKVRTLGAELGLLLEKGEA